MAALVALNLTAIDSYGPLPANVSSPPSKRSYKTSKLVPFNTNFVAQIMTCQGSSAPQIRFIL